MSETFLIGKGEVEVTLLPRMANRHGLIAGATGTGKTITLQVMAENFSRLGVPVFLADVKGDLSGISQPGVANARISERLETLGLADFGFEGFPVAFWDIHGEKGHPLRATISEMGPLLLGRLLQLNDTQEGVLNLVFKIADDNGMLLLDLKDLKAILQYAGDNAKSFQTEYGHVSPASVGAIQRALLAIEQQNGAALFGEPALELFDLMRVAPDGRGVINILAADKLMQFPRLYSTFLLWLMSELFEELPEVGDPEKPRLVFFFDEAHLLFDEAPPALLEKIEQVVRLIRSKGVGVYFISQNPMDIPISVLGQLGNRVQHALRAFTPVDQKAVRAAAQTFRPKAGIDVEKVIIELGVGEALVSVLDKSGSPTPVERTLIVPPHSRIGPIEDAQRGELVRRSPVYGRYEKALDRESAFEILKARAAMKAAEAPPPAKGRTSTSTFEKVATSAMQSAARSMGTQLGRGILRGILGSIFGGSSGRRKSSTKW